MPTSLFQEAPAIVTKKAGEFQKTRVDREHFTKRGKAMWAELQGWYPTLRQLSTYIYPTRGFFQDNKPNSGYAIDHQTVIDSTAEDCVDTLMAGMASGLTSPSRPWKKLELGIPELEKKDEVKWWLDDLNKSMDDIFQHSNFYGAMEMVYAELGVFGTAACFIEEDADDVIKCNVFTTGEYALGCDHKGRVNAFYRPFWLTVGQLVSKFGLENCSGQVQAAYKNGQVDVWRRVYMLIEQNDDIIVQERHWKNMPFRSAYWEDGTDAKSYLRLGGYEEFPVLAPRWTRTTTSNVYGRGPGWKALGDVKMLQKLHKDELLAIEKVGNPPMQADASVDGEVNTLPGGVTRTSAMTPNGGVRAAYQINPDIQALDLKIEKTRDQIKKKFLTDLFLMMIEAERAGTPVTATEIMEKQSEKVSRLGPVLEANKDELHTPAIERTYNIMRRMGLVPEPPPIIADMNIHVKYISVLHQAQRMTQLTPVLQWTQIIGQVAGIGHPEILDKINADQIADDSAEFLGIPTKEVVSAEKVAVIRKQRAEEQARQAQAAQTLAMAEAAKKGAGAVKDMAQAPMDENTALNSTLAALSGRQ